MAVAAMAEVATAEVAFTVVVAAGIGAAADSEAAAFTLDTVGHAQDTEARTQALTSLAPDTAACTASTEPQAGGLAASTDRA